MKRITKIEANRPDPFASSKLRVAAYCRVSTDSKEQAESLKAQTTYYEQHIKTNPEWKYAGIYYDEGISGTKKENREGLQRLITDCENKQIDLIITKSISRFARNTMDCLEMVRRLVEIGVFIYFEKENINTQSMESELMLSILSSLAESESTSISENNKWAVQKRFQNGTFIISYPPYAYENINGQMVVNEDQAKIVKYIFNRALAGIGTQRIANALNDKNVPSKRGGKWSGTTIRGILVNEKYIGDAIFQKTYTDSSFNRHTNYGEKNKYLIENHHEAIISREDFEKVALILDQRAREKGIEKRNSKYQNRYSFSSKIICSECGGTFKRRIHCTGKNKYVAWTCNTHLDSIEECSMLFIRDEDIKNAFVTMMNKLIFGKDFILKPLLNKLKLMSKSGNLSKIETLEEKIESNRKQQDLLVSLMAKKYLEPALFNKEKNELQMEKDNLIEAKEGLIQELNSELSKGQEVSSLIKFANKIEVVTDFEDEIFSQHVEKIIVFSREELGFALKCGITPRERM